METSLYNRHSLKFYQNFFSIGWLDLEKALETLIEYRVKVDFVDDFGECLSHTATANEGNVGEALAIIVRDYYDSIGDSIGEAIDFDKLDVCAIVFLHIENHLNEILSECDLYVSAYCNYCDSHLSFEFSEEDLKEKLLSGDLSAQALQDETFKAFLTLNLELNVEDLIKELENAEQE